MEAAACSAQKSACPSSNLPSWLGRCGLWSWMNSTPFEGSTWDIAVEPLRLQGQGTLISDRITFESTSRSSVFLDFVANSIDQNFTVNYPGPQNWYTLNTGFVSLFFCFVPAFTDDTKAVIRRSIRHRPIYLCQWIKRHS